MVSSDAAANNAGANGASVFANLPNELKDSVINQLPADLANQVLPHRISQKRRRMAASRAAVTIERLKSTSATPITKLPTEIRAKIFKHLLPDKANSFVPLKMLKHCQGRRQKRRVRAAIMGGLIPNPASENVIINDVDSGDASILDVPNGAEISFRNKMDFDNMILPLMLTCRQFCIEVSTIMYEEYTFELHVHHDGLDFLDLKRINILEDYGVFENTLCKYGKFESTGSFSFRRMKHLKFVLWGGNPTDRTAGMRMRHTINKLIDLLVDEEKPLTTLVIEFEQDVDAKDDRIGSFWRNNSTHEARSSIWHCVSNIELITSPFMRLRNVSKIGLDLPVGVEDTNSFAYRQHFCSTLRETEPIVTDGLVSYEHEQMVMDAVMDYQLQHAPVPTEGYYHPDKATHAVDHDIFETFDGESVSSVTISPLKATTIPLLTETEVDEGGSMVDWNPKSDPILSIVYQTIENGVRFIEDWKKDLAVNRHLIPGPTPCFQEIAQGHNPPQLPPSPRTIPPVKTSTPDMETALVTTLSPVKTPTSVNTTSPVETHKPLKFPDMAGVDGHYKPLKEAMSHMFSIGRDSTPLHQQVPHYSYSDDPIQDYCCIEAPMDASLLDNDKCDDDDDDDDTHSLLSVY